MSRTLLYSESRVFDVVAFAAHQQKLDELPATSYAYQVRLGLLAEEHARLVVCRTATQQGLAHYQQQQKMRDMLSVVELAANLERMAELASQINKEMQAEQGDLPTILRELGCQDLWNDFTAKAHELSKQLTAYDNHLHHSQQARASLVVEQVAAYTLKPEVDMPSLLKAMDILDGGMLKEEQQVVDDVLNLLAFSDEQKAECEEVIRQNYREQKAMIEEHQNELEHLTTLLNNASASYNASKELLFDKLFSLQDISKHKPEKLAKVDEALKQLDALNNQLGTRPQPIAHHDADKKQSQTALNKQQQPTTADDEVNQQRHNRPTSRPG